ncbi:hypothetical protein ACFO4P_03645 [Epilithonimonas pallida]|uniref:Lipoprotein n=1 Tax=Epilithonimonas pallida TaxID=373671 RepID=A0ABY1QZS6_9FLAO|nr:hypothetical protein [Epilithonimonas pallida]SMP90875.1 hypothetical protein SAMN05421679_102469 [Epilithonimonas pallida]
MKRKYYIPSSILLFLVACKDNEVKVQKYINVNSKDLAFLSVKQNNLNEYYTIQDFLNAFSPKLNIDKKIIEDDPPGKAIKYIVYSQNQNIRIEFYPDGFKHMADFDINRKWNIQDFEKEDVKRIDFFYRDILIETIYRY